MHGYGPWINLFVAQIVLFVVFLVALRRLILSDTMKAVKKLRQVEVEVGRKEEEIRRRMEENEQEVVRKTAAAQEEFRKARDASEKELGQMREKLTEESKRERDRIIAEAEKHKERLKNELMRETDKQAVIYAGSVFELVFSEKIGGILNRGFVDELLGALEEVDAGAIAIEADKAEFVSSHPLDEEQRTRIRDVIARKFQVQVDVHEKVDATLLAGLKIKLGGLEIDGSLLNRFHEAMEEVKKSRVG